MTVGGCIIISSGNLKIYHYTTDCNPATIKRSCSSVSGSYLWMDKHYRIIFILCMQITGNITTIQIQPLGHWCFIFNQLCCVQCVMENRSPGLHITVHFPGTAAHNEAPWLFWWRWFEKLCGASLLLEEPALPLEPQQTGFGEGLASWRPPYQGEARKRCTGSSSQWGLESTIKPVVPAMRCQQEAIAKNQADTREPSPAYPVALWGGQAA